MKADILDGISGKALQKVDVKKKKPVKVGRYRSGC